MKAHSQPNSDLVASMGLSKWKTQSRHRDTMHILVGRRPDSTGRHSYVARKVFPIFCNTRSWSTTSAASKRSDTVVKLKLRNYAHVTWEVES